MDTMSRIKNQVSKNPLLLYMKGTPEMPKCGFSSQVVHILKQSQVPFAYIDILEELDIRKVLPQFANWPTFPQVYLHGELIGGCDIVTELYEQGALTEMFDKAGIPKTHGEATLAVE